MTKINKFAKISNKKIVPHLITNKINHKVAAKFLNVNPSSITNYYKEFKKSMNLYNQEYIKDKYETNDKFLELIKPETALDLFCGVNSYYKNKNCSTISNDFDQSIKADFNMDAKKLLTIFNKLQFDLIDVDPFGCPMEYLDLAIPMARKGLIVTYGDFLNLRRFKVEKTIKRNYGLNAESFNLENVIQKTIEKAAKYNKKLKPLIVKIFKSSLNTDAMVRVYYNVEEL